MCFTIRNSLCYAVRCEPCERLAFTHLCGSAAYIYICFLQVTGNSILENWYGSMDLTGLCSTFGT